MTQNPRIKILVCYHKPAPIIQSDMLVPIHVGRAVATEKSKDGSLSQGDYQWLLDHMIGDDTGDNISHLNRRYSELTAFYWAWKNYDKLGNPDYIGFCHYRRYMDFLNSVPPERVLLGATRTAFLPKALHEAYDKRAPEIMNKIAQTDIIHTTRLKGKQTVYEQFKGFERPDVGLKYSVFKEVFADIPTRCPSFAPGAQAYLASTFQYCYNTFVMKKEIFMEYCNFVFPLLFAEEKKIDYNQFSINGQRILGYVAERLTGAFITQYQMKGARVDCVPMVYIENTDIIPHVSPAFKEKNIPVVFSCDDKYAPYLAVCLQSVISHTSTEHNYDINILVEKLSPQIQDDIRLMQKENVSIRFWTISSLLFQLDRKLFYLKAHFSLSVYYRFFIPRLFCNYKKVLYLDCDMVVLEDVAKLYQTELGQACIGAAQDVGVYSYLYMDWFNKTGWMAYAKNILQLKNPWSYFQSGVLLMDIQKLLNINIEQKCLEVLAHIEPRCVDQCILNRVLQGRVKQLPLSWNVEWHLPFFSKVEQELPAALYTAWKNACEEPYILHYSSQIKPWQYIENPLAYYWWKYARQTPFYEQFLIRAAWQYLKRFIQLSMENGRCGALSKITFGKKCEHYKRKKQQAHAELRRIKKFIREGKHHA